LRSAANDVIDLTPLFRTFDIVNTHDVGRARAAGPATRSPAGALDERPTKVQDAPAQVPNRTPRQQQQRGRRPRFHPVATARQPGES
jgi:hypothetical protein